MQLAEQMVAIENELVELSFKVVYGKSFEEWVIEQIDNNKAKEGAKEILV